MPWWLDVVLLLSGVVLWCTSGRRSDDVWSMFQKIIAVLVVMLVLLGGRWVPLEVLILGGALFLPSAGRFDQRDRAT